AGGPARLRRSAEVAGTGQGGRRTDGSLPSPHFEPTLVAGLSNRAVSRIAIAIGATSLALAVPAGAAELRFREVAAELGVRFEHRHFGTGEKYMPENMGAGVAVLDYDGDGRLDLFFVQGAPIGPGLVPPRSADG